MWNTDVKELRCDGHARPCDSKAGFRSWTEAMFEGKKADWLVTFEYALCPDCKKGYDEERNIMLDRGWM